MKIINSVRYRAKGTNSSTIIIIIMCFNTQPCIAMTPRDCNVDKTVICKILGNLFPLTITKFNSKLPHKENKNFNLDISLYE